jgi:trans-aconitate methyltransferase
VVSEDLTWVPPGVAAEKASSARVYDYWLGGSHNFQADRDAARAIIALEPNARAIAGANRDFLGRVVRFVCAAGVRQFLDIGSGIPTEGNVHEIAQQAVPAARVVYVDVDPVAVAHSRAILRDNPDADVVQADVRDPEKILASPRVRRLIDFSQPVGLLLVAVLHFLSDGDNPWQVVGALRDALVPGSYLAVSHAAREGRPAVVAAAREAYNSKVAASVAMRSRSEVRRFFEGFDLLDPGVVFLPEWRPDAPEDVPGDPSKLWGLVGVGRRR